MSSYQLSPLIDTAAARFNADLELKEEDKADFKIKAKQFVKIYGQMASIMPYEIAAWEKLFWFLKFLIPKLKIKDPDSDKIDELLESVDLSSYGLERIKFINIADSIKAHPDFEEKYKNNQDTHNRELAFEKIFEEVMLKNRRNELDLYKLLSSDAAFKTAMQQSLRQLIS
ncbi:hypothetical protein [Thiolapillus sp.]|uniref:hypothetical protein n=1 Tax=Thiolapillus sp. TaxID=2017437 RepID=UPI003AF5EA05